MTQSLADKSRKKYRAKLKNIEMQRYEAIIEDVETHGYGVVEEVDELIFHRKLRAAGFTLSYEEVHHPRQMIRMLGYDYPELYMVVK